MQTNLLSQHVNENTRKNKSILDLVITNSPETIHSVTVESTNLSDHDLITTKILNENLMIQEKQSEHNPVNPFDQLNWTKAKWDDIRREIAGITWKQELENKDVEQMCAIINNKVTEVANNNCPKHKTGARKSNHIPRERRSLIRTRKHINANINFLKYVKQAHTKLQLESKDIKIKKLEERLNVNLFTVDICR